MFAYAAAAPSAVAPPAGVYFQDDGHIAGWDNKNPKPQKKGVIRDVASPAYMGNSAMETQHTYISSDGRNYHTETVHAHAQSLNEDRYYGQAGASQLVVVRLLAVTRAILGTWRTGTTAEGPGHDLRRSAVLAGSWPAVVAPGQRRVLRGVARVRRAARCTAAGVRA